jgi:hypothetical protein
LSDGSVKISDSCSVAEYHQLEKGMERAAIASVIVARFEGRYLDPVSVHCGKKNGFTMMAVSCLMIEALESFCCGWIDTRNKSESAFLGFFSRWPTFKVFESVSGDFYRHVRCGILHQAETTGGWRILRSGPLLREHTINATKFLNALRSVLGDYADALRESEWDSDLWKAARTKMDAVCRNTQQP